MSAGRAMPIAKGLIPKMLIPRFSFDHGSRHGCRVTGSTMAEFGRMSRLSHTLSIRIPYGFHTDKMAEVSQAYAYDGFVFRVWGAALGCNASVVAATRSRTEASYLLRGLGQLEKARRVAFQSRLKGGRSRNLIEP
jgi:hypothetical protein